jgi:hypothetical protein
MQANPVKGKRVVHHADAIAWLKEQSMLDGCSIITSLPDISEFPKMSLDEWKIWFVDTAALVLSKCSEEGITLFYQSDIKRDGIWVDKGFLCQQAAEKIGHELIAHKIICRAPTGTNTFVSPGYSHLLCFSKALRPDISKSLPDVLPEAGEVTWMRGMGTKACELACRMVMSFTNSRTIVDPFCGHGTILAVANEFGLDAIGVELKLKHSKTAETLDIKNL